MNRATEDSLTKEITMKQSIFSTMAVFLIFGAVVTLSSRVVPDTDTAGVKSYYGFIIDKVITECRERSRLRGDRLERASVLNCLKAAYFTLRREELIIELVAKKIGLSGYLTRYHLNRNFYEIIRKWPAPARGAARLQRPAAGLSNHKPPHPRGKGSEVS